MMRNAQVIVSALLLGALGAAQARAAVIVNVDLATFGGVFNGTGAAPSAGTFWNNLPGPGGGINDLLADDGVTTTPFDISLQGWTGQFQYPGANLLMQWRLFGPDNGTAFIDLAGLDPARQYDLYLYGSFWDATYSVPGLGPETATGDSLTTVWVEGDQYVLLQGAMPALDGTLTVTVSAGGSGAGQWTVVSGLQIVELSAVPEPGSLMLVGMGLAGLAGTRWRRRAR